MFSVMPLKILHPKTLIAFASGLTVLTILWTFKSLFINERWAIADPQESQSPSNPLSHSPSGRRKKAQDYSQAPFVPGIVPPPGTNYSKMLVIPRTQDEDIEWISYPFISSDAKIQATIYTVDDPVSSNHLPRNKGNEVMVYISYIIDNYHNLSDITLFMHAHRFSWHNNFMLDKDIFQMISRLSSERVIREGYMNMRCDWEPGCPAWMHPGSIEEDVNKQEASILAQSWREIFPEDPIPKVLAQPCCSQFALSRERIRALPLEKYVGWREWLLETKLPDWRSGRVWEYFWQWVWMGREIVCPMEWVCYCDGYGVCFGGEDGFREVVREERKLGVLERELEQWNRKVEEIRKLREEGRNEEADRREIPEAGRDEELKREIEDVKEWCKKRIEEAKRNGDSAVNRAKEAGREWKDGDGF